MTPSTPATLEPERPALAEPTHTGELALPPADEGPRLAPDGLPMDEFPILPSWFRSLVAQHPGLALTLGYVGLTAIGMMYDIWYFIRFRVAILNYAETADFLLAALREPLVVMLSLVTVPVFKIFMRTGRWLRKRSKKMQAMQRRYEASSWYLPYRSSIGPFFVFIYAVLFTAWYSEWTSNRVMAGRGRRVQAEFSAAASPALAAALAAEADSGARARASAAALADPRPMLVGTTGKYVFLYYLRDRSTHIVPLEALERLVIVPRSREPKVSR